MEKRRKPAPKKKLDLRRDKLAHLTRLDEDELGHVVGGAEALDWYHGVKMSRCC